MRLAKQVNWWQGLLASLLAAVHLRGGRGKYSIKGPRFLGFSLHVAAVTLFR